MIELIGMAAAVLSVIALFPQWDQLRRTKSGADISARTYIMRGIGATLWLIYGIGTLSVPIIGANLCILALSVSILVLKARYRP